MCKFCKAGVCPDTRAGHTSWLERSEEGDFLHTVVGDEFTDKDAERIWAENHQGRWVAWRW